MEPTQITFAPFGNRFTPVTVCVEIDLYVDYRTKTPDPDSKEVPFVERAVMRVNGADVPHELTQAQLDALLVEHLDEQQDLDAENRAIQQRWAA